MSDPKLHIASADHDSAILVGDADHNDIAEFFHADHATVGQSYEYALSLAQFLVDRPALIAERDAALQEASVLREALRECVSQLLPFNEDGDQPAIDAAINAARAALTQGDV